MKLIIDISEEATNGDIIKALFPNLDDTQIEGITIQLIDYADYEITRDWWNAPYQKGGE